ncbi:hypothetical protein FWH09_01830 [Candidatus Saccharibacteria bacterium]|nr:hypothetical protein [Candidatus Saccharibacteria bacterium]
MASRKIAVAVLRHSSNKPILESSGWSGAFSNSAFESGSWFIRGGNSLGTTGAGVESIYDSNGFSNASIRFRGERTAKIGQNPKKWLSYAILLAFCFQMRYNINTFRCGQTERRNT